MANTVKQGVSGQTIEQQGSINVREDLKVWNGTAFEDVASQGEVIGFNVGSIIKGDGTDQVVTLQVVLDNQPDGSTLFFPSGTYIVANDTERLFFSNRKNLTFLGETGTIFTNLLGKGGASGENILFQECENITVRRISPGDTVLTRWSTFNNHIAFIDTKGIIVEECEFGDSSNKHIHIGGSSNNILIRRNNFSGSCYNSNPLPGASSSFSSLFFAFDNDIDQHTLNVTVTENTFRGQNLYSISANNSSIATPGFEDVFSNFNIFNNCFYDCTGGIVGRGDNINIYDNYFENVGVSYVLNAYDYDPGTARYYSKTRSVNNPGVLPDASNTLLPLLGGLININQGKNSRVFNNNYKNCLNAQILPSPQANPAIIYIGGQDNKRCLITNNQFSDDTLPAGTLPPHIRFLGTTGTTDCFFLNNTFLLPTGYTSSSIIRCQNGTANLATNNKVKILSAGVEIDYAGNVYQDIADGGVTQADLATKVNKTGDTMSGTLSIISPSSRTLDLYRQLPSIGSSHPFRFLLQTADGTQFVAGQIVAASTDVTNGAPSANLILSTMLGGTLATKITLTSTGVFNYASDVTSSLGALSLTHKTYVDARKLTVTQVIDFPSVPANSESAGVNVTVTGATSGDATIACFVTTNVVGLDLKAVTTSNNTVTVYAKNFTALPIDPPSGSVKVVVFK